MSCNQNNENRCGQRRCAQAEASSSGCGQSRAIENGCAQVEAILNGCGQSRAVENGCAQVEAILNGCGQSRPIENGCAQATPSGCGCMQEEQSRCRPRCNCRSQTISQQVKIENFHSLCSATVFQKGIRPFRCGCRQGWMVSYEIEIAYRACCGCCKTEVVPGSTIFWDLPEWDEDDRAIIRVCNPPQVQNRCGTLQVSTQIAVCIEEIV